jgi:DNA repair protein RadD
MLRPYQQAVKDEIYDAWRSGKRNVVAVMPTGAGKCLGHGTPVIMADATTKAVQSVIAGDLLMGPDSVPRRVVSTCTGREMLYRVTPTRGDSYVVNESHILSLRRTQEDAGETRHRAKIINMSVRDYLVKSKTFRHIHKGWRAPADFGTCRPDIDPYFLGLWLGDGDSRSTCITTGDPEVYEFLKALAERLGLRVKIDLNSRLSANIFLNTGRKGRGSGNVLLDQLKRLDLIRNKHVPHVVKLASAADRLEFLAGFIDSDGSLGNGHYDVIGISEAMIRDVAFVARSLGFAAYVSPCQKTCGNNGVVGNYFRLSISGDVSRIPCKILRKQAGPRRQKKNVLRTGITVEPVGVGDYYGFELDGPNKLFLLGDFTVTHNTKLMSSIFDDNSEPEIAIAHRQELVGQISCAMAGEGIHHNIVAPEPVIRFCIQQHVKRFNRNFHHPNAPTHVAGVDTLIARKDKLEQLCNSVRLWAIDEAHHVLPKNKWGKAVDLFPRAIGLGPTATPRRCDNQPLGHVYGGVFNHMVIGPTMRDLINMGFLSEYRIFAPPASIARSSLKVSENTGEFTPESTRDASHKSPIVGDIVQQYLRIAPGKRGITFVVDVETAKEVAARFVAAGVPAEAVSAKTDDATRQRAIERFARGELLQLVNVDLFGEGFDVPAVEVVSDGAPTQSFSKFAQRFGRMLRLFEGKTHGIYIDHVENVIQHGLPDAPRNWSLDIDYRGSRKRDKDENVIPVRTCVKCYSAYEAVTKVCPYCGHVDVPAPGARLSPDMVDGDLSEFAPELLARLRGEIGKVDHEWTTKPRSPAEIVMQRNHAARYEALQQLRETMNYWAGIQVYGLGRSESEAYRRFYHKYGVDTLTAQTLSGPEMSALIDKIRVDMI